MNRPSQKSSQPLVVWGLIGINVILFFYMHHFSGYPSGSGRMMYHFGAMFTSRLEEGQDLWRLFTAMFLHFDIEHLASNMLSLFVMGSIVENGVGHIRTLFIYLLSGLGGNIVSQLWHQYIGENVLSAGASGAVFGLMGALIFASLFARDRMEGLSPLQIGLMLVLSLYHGVADSVDNAAHIGGLLCGFLLCGLLLKLFPGKKRTDPYDPFA